VEIAAVAFDVDGTLYPPSSLYFRAMPLVLRNVSLFSAFNTVRRDIRAHARTAAYRGAPPRDGGAFRLYQASLTARRLGWDEARTAELIDSRIYRGVAELFAGIQPFRGLESAMGRIRAAGLRLAALSDLPLERKISLMGFGEAFEFALCSEDFGFLKPEPESFLALAEALGLPPRRILYVGNSPAYDLYGAKAVGMRAAIVSRRAVPGADLSFYDWSEFADFAISLARSA
jgi:putative hydrolase of the HAD superfamily